MSDEQKEQLAHYEHKSWNRWMLWLYDPANGIWNDNGSYTINPVKAKRWLDLAKIDYKQLDEATKQYDRDEVVHILPVIEAAIVQARISELGGIWYSGKNGEYSAIRTDSGKGGETIGQRVDYLNQSLNSSKGEK